MMSKRYGRIKHNLVTPQIVPIPMILRLHKAGIKTTAEVHRHIEQGTLQRLHGIGPAWEKRIIRWYTKGKNRA